MKAKISIAVIAYNSELTIIETLNSILIQTYGVENIELIISDDCSTDLTISILDNWVLEFGNKFYKIKVIKGSQNVGVAKNCNSAWKACTGEWIKTIAADDLLMPECIDVMVDYVSNNTNIKWLFSDMLKFDGSRIYTEAFSHLCFFKMEPYQQFRHLIIGNFLNAPSSFINRNALSEIDFADETFRLIEDYPLWLKVTANGNKVYYNDIKMVKYRIGESVSKSRTRIINQNFFLEESLIRKKFAIKYLNKLDWLFWVCLWDHAINKCIYLVFSIEKLNSKKIIGNFIYRGIMLCSPLRYIRKIRHWLFLKYGN